MSVSYRNGHFYTDVNVKDASNPPKDLGTKPFAIDTGSPESSISADVATGGSWVNWGSVTFLTPTGPATFPKVGGGSMSFQVDAPSGGGEVTIVCTKSVFISKVNILGRDQLAGTTVKLNPGLETGSIKKK